MIEINYPALVASLLDQRIPRPNKVGTISGHAAGEPFDRLVYDSLRAEQPAHTFRQFEFLNALYTKNSAAVTYALRHALLDAPAVLFLLSRGKDSTRAWTADAPFEEKQDDTADVLVTDGQHYELLDVKTRAMHKKAQTPNIISAYKLAQLCAIMRDNAEYGSFGVTYVGIDWEAQGEELVCRRAYYKRLFLTPPAKLYINWTAGYQIQVHLAALDQSFTGTVADWTLAYLQHYVAAARGWLGKAEAKHITPFLKYLA